MLALSQNFALVLFVYALGLEVGPSFFPSLRKGGIKLNLLAFAVLLIGTFMAVGLSALFGIPLPVGAGLLSGAVTNTPMLGAAQQTLLQINPEASDLSNTMATACAVGYPFGVVGVMICVMILRVLFRKRLRALLFSGIRPDTGKTACDATQRAYTIFLDKTTKKIFLYRLSFG